MLKLNFLFSCIIPFFPPSFSSFSTFAYYDSKFSMFVSFLPSFFYHYLASPTFRLLVSFALTECVAFKMWHQNLLFEQNFSPLFCQRNWNNLLTYLYLYFKIIVRTPLPLVPGGLIEFWTCDFVEAGPIESLPLVG